MHYSYSSCIFLPLITVAGRTSWLCRSNKAVCTAIAHQAQCSIRRVFTSRIYIKGRLLCKARTNAGRPAARLSTRPITGCLSAPWLCFGHGFVVNNRSYSYLSICRKRQDVARGFILIIAAAPLAVLATSPWCLGCGATPTAPHNRRSLA